jgi:DNA (cytosine-5)-methyltransferase 1
MDGGFSGRSVDTKYITPTLKELKLPSMSESGWLTRSLEQPYPYNNNYNGKIGSVEVKKSFLDIVNYIETQPNSSLTVVQFLLFHGIKIREENRIEITPIENPEKITIDSIIESLKTLFDKDYKISGGSKFPVISFHCIYTILVNELKRFEGCSLGELGSHTSSDRTSKSSGDIEIFDKNRILIESLEIKLNIEIDEHIVNRVLEKIIKYNPKRYYVLTSFGIKEEDYYPVMAKVNFIKNKHGCQLILNGLLPTLKYYLRLINDLQMFVDLFTEKINEDTELKIIHKLMWKEIRESYF